MTRGERNIKWIESMIIIPDGPSVGKPLILQPFLKEDIKAIFDNPHGTRRAIISRGRKNGKSFITACLLLLYICGPEAQKNAQYFSAARSRDQASLIFNLCKQMIKMNPRLEAYTHIIESKKTITCPAIGTIYKALSSEATTAYGLNPALIIHDELGQVLTDEDPLYTALETAAGAQPNPMTIIISTQAPTDTSLLSLLIDDAIQNHDPHTIVRLNSYTGDDPFTQEAIEEANPAFHHFQNKKELLDQMQKAKRMPSKQASYLNLVLNQRVSAQASLLNPQQWIKCKSDFDDSIFDNKPIYLGLDLSKTKDLTAVVALTEVDDTVYMKSFFFTPENTLKDRAKQDKAPYERWVKSGHLIAVPGDTVDLDEIAKWTIQWIKDHPNTKIIGYDAWRADIWIASMKRQGFKKDITTKVSQAYKVMEPAITTLEDMVISHKFLHQNNPVMNMCIQNCVIKTDVNGNRMPDKSKQRKRIDGVPAMLNAISVMDKDMTKHKEPITIFSL